MTHTLTRVTAITLGTALLATTFIVFAPTASADERHDSRGADDVTRVSNMNGAVVVNAGGAMANTGYNDANGRAGGDARASGGDATGGRGGNGGLVVSGTATAVNTIANDVNSNRTVIESCGCDEDNDRLDRRHGHNSDRGGNDTEVSVRNTNMAMVMNLGMAYANTGGNDVNGGAGGDARTNGSLRGLYTRGHHGHNQGGTDATGGRGGDAGTIRTSAAYADNLTTNLVNRNVTRIGAGEAAEEVDPV